MDGKQNVEKEETELEPTIFLYPQEFFVLNTAL